MVSKDTLLKFLFLRVFLCAEFIFYAYQCMNEHTYSHLGLYFMFFLWFSHTIEENCSVSVSSADEKLSVSLDALQLKWPKHWMHSFLKLLLSF